MFVGQMFVLRGPALALPALQEHVPAIQLQGVGRGAGHQVEPVRVLRQVAIVRPLVLGDVQMVLIAVDDQRDLGNVALVKPVARDALSRGPTPQVTCDFLQPAAKQRGLLVRFGGQPAEDRHKRLPRGAEIRRRVDRCGLSHGCIARRHAVVDAAGGDSSVARGGGPWNW